MSIGTCGFEASYCRNNHKSQQKLEKTKEGEVHDREILLSKIITINLKPSGPTDYFLFLRRAISQPTTANSRDPKTCRIDIGISNINMLTPAQIPLQEGSKGRL
jgi:hypothetical protein